MIWATDGGQDRSPQIYQNRFSSRVTRQSPPGGPPKASRGRLSTPRGHMFQLIGSTRGFIFKLLWGASGQIRSAPPNDDALTQTLATSSQQQSKTSQPTQQPESQPPQSLRREARPNTRGGGGVHLRRITMQNKNIFSLIGRSRTNYQVPSSPRKQPTRSQVTN